jgi:hypothetical protein
MHHFQQQIFCSTKINKEISFVNYTLDHMDKIDTELSFHSNRIHIFL